MIDAMQSQAQQLRAFTLVSVISAVSALLAACGGGGDASNDSAPATTNAPAANGTGISTSSGSTAPTVAADPIDKYVGSVLTACSQAFNVQTADTGATVYQTFRFTSLSKISATQVLMQKEIEFYKASNCSGVPIGTLKLAGANTFFKVDGSAKVGDETADKLTQSEDPYFPGISAKTIQFNGMQFTGEPYFAQTAQTYKDLAMFDGKSLFTGDWRQPVGSDGYPTALLAKSTATKQ